MTGPMDLSSKLAAVPVSSRTNQGAATAVIMLPTCEMALAPNSAKIGARSAMAGSCSVTTICLLLLLLQDTCKTLYPYPHLREHPTGVLRRTPHCTQSSEEDTSA